MSEAEQSDGQAGGQAGGQTYVEADGFDRDMTYVPDRITQGARRPEHGPAQGELWPAEPGRYRLVAAKACPWANRAIIVRSLLGLDDVISLGLCGPTHDARSWTFDLDPGGRDPVLGIERLQEAYFRRFPDYPRGITVPAIVEEATGRLVTNDFPWITHDFFHEWREHHRADAPDLWPAALRDEMEQVMKRVFTEVNNGVYRCGFAGSQSAYDAAYERLWVALDWLEERLSTQRYLMGEAITEADVRLFTTLARFDAVYHGHFKHATCFRRPASARRSTSTRSRSTTTSSTATSTRPASCRPAPTRPCGSSPTDAGERLTPWDTDTGTAAPQATAPRARPTAGGCAGCWPSPPRCSSSRSSARC
jgi:putative glutathione S-transferase